MAKKVATKRKPKMNLITTVDFSEGKNAQSIYTSQLYGTFFSIHALIDTSTTATDNYYLINSMKLFIVNYKGVLNLGIKQAEFKAEKNNKWAWKLKIEVEIQGFTEIDKQNFIVKTAKGKKILKPKIHQVGNDRPIIKRRSQIFVQRYALPVGKPFSKDGKIFDDENYFRQGVIRNITRAERKKEHRPTEWSNLKPAQGGSGFVCPLSELHVL